MFVPYFSCQVPQVYQGTVQQAMADSQALALQQRRQSVGLGCAGECGCGGSCGMHGLTDFTAPGGFFSTMDFSQWGMAEWGSILAGVYVVGSLVGDTKRGAKKIRRIRRSAKK